jgi:hypothetical protein
MPETLTSTFDSFLNSPVISRIRRNHGLEHATLHILSERFPGVPMAGHSTAAGFRLLGNIPTEAVQAAVEEALRRMQEGEAKLAVHPNCGTNFVTAGTLSGLAGAAAMFGAGRRTRDKVERIPMAIVLATLALIAAYPLGMKVQEKVTTSGKPEGLQVTKITRTQRGAMTIHQVLTQG